jgi:hypothetical protein
MSLYTQPGFGEREREPSLKKIITIFLFERTKIEVNIKRNARHPNIFFPELGSNLMCQKPMKLWYTSQNDKSHGIVTH